MTTVLESAVSRRKNVEAPCLAPCPIERGMRIIGGKWKGSILWHLKDEPVRFNDLARQLGGASKKMVDQRLKELEAQGLVKREVLSTRPIAVAYQATEFGRSALGVLEMLKDWAEEHDI
ncbi:MAG: helix-turn-helix domain-containing protein [Acidobacteriota bacterium]|nr:helix-turn-helix domain-containing protein [Acidobacteriota bacterium]